MDYGPRQLRGTRLKSFGFQRHGRRFPGIVRESPALRGRTRTILGYSGISSPVWLTSPPSSGASSRWTTAFGTANFVSQTISSTNNGGGSYGIYYKGGPPNGYNNELYTISGNELRNYRTVP